MDAWVEVENVLRDIFKRVVSEVLHSDLGKPSLFVNALLGKISLVNSKAERLVTTLIGEQSVNIVKPFFIIEKTLDPPFHFQGRLKHSPHRLYAVKIVSSPRAFNSTMRRAVIDAAENYDNPVILTLQGVFNNGHTTMVGKAKWYDAVATWALLANDKYGYARFKKLVYDAAKPYRVQLVSKILSEIDEHKARQHATSSIH